MKKALPLVLLLAAGTSGCLTMSDTNTIIGYSLNQHGRTPLGDLNLVAGEIGSRHETRRAIRDSEARLTDEIRRQGQGGQEYGGEPPRRYPDFFTCKDRRNLYNIEVEWLGIKNNFSDDEPVYIVGEEGGKTYTFQVFNADRRLMIYEDKDQNKDKTYGYRHYHYSSDKLGPGNYSAKWIFEDGSVHEQRFSIR